MMKKLLFLVPLVCFGQGSRVFSPTQVVTGSTTPEVRLYRANTTKTGSLYGDTAGFGLENDAGTKKLTVIKTSGNVQVGDAVTDHGFAFHVTGNIFATGNITCGGTCGGGGGGGNPFDDSGALVFHSGDPTTQMRIDLTNLTMGAFRVLKSQDANYTLAGLETVQTFTANQTFAGHIFAGGTLLNIGSTGTPFQDQFLKQSYSETLRVAQTATSFATSFAFKSTSTNILRLENPSATLMQDWDCSAGQCVSHLVNVNLSVRGASSGTNYPVVFASTTGTSGVNYFVNTSTKAGSYSCGVTACSMQNDVDLFRVVAFHNGDVQIDDATDRGYNFWVNGTMGVASSITLGSGARRFVSTLSGVAPVVTITNDTFNNALDVTQTGTGLVSAIQGVNTRTGLAGLFVNSSGTAGTVALQANSFGGPGLQVSGTGATYPDIAIGSGTTVGIFLRNGAPTGTCQKGSLWLRADGGAGTTGYPCTTGTWGAAAW